MILALSSEVLCEFNERGAASGLGYTVSAASTSLHSEIVSLQPAFVFTTGATAPLQLFPTQTSLSAGQDTRRGLDYTVRQLPEPVTGEWAGPEWPEQFNDVKGPDFSSVPLSHPRRDTELSSWTQGGRGSSQHPVPTPQNSHQGADEDRAIISSLFTILFRFFNCPEAPHRCPLQLIAQTGAT